MRLWFAERVSQIQVANPPSQPARADQRLVGAKYLKVLAKHLNGLRRAGDHPNRVLHYDDLLTLQLLGFFNPTLRSLRTLEDASTTPGFRECLDVDRACRSTISDANACLDPALLLPLIEDLRVRVPNLPRADRQLQQLFQRTIAVDGSLFSVAGNVAWALRKRKPWSKDADNRLVRLDLQYCCVTGLIEGLEINGKGTSETTAARRQIRPGALYVADRGIFSFAYVQDLMDAGADLVLRIKISQRLQVVEERAVTPDQKAAGVLQDRLVRLAPSQPGVSAPAEMLREVVIFDPRNPAKPLRLLTNLTDVEAQVIGEVYRWRWQIELFFRWLKVHAHFRHVISHNKNGLTLSFYVADFGELSRVVIGVLLIYLHTGRRVSKYAYNLLSMVAQGWADLADILPVLERREHEKELARRRLERKKAQKNPA
jgi:hypothetical protein